jgi:hypothetical protein
LIRRAQVEDEQQRKVLRTGMDPRIRKGGLSKRRGSEDPDRRVAEARREARPRLGGRDGRRHPTAGLPDSRPARRGLDLAMG